MSDAGPELDAGWLDLLLRAGRTCLTPGVSFLKTFTRKQPKVCSLDLEEVQGSQLCLGACGLWSWGVDMEGPHHFGFIAYLLYCPLDLF